MPSRLVLSCPWSRSRTYSLLSFLITPHCDLALMSNSHLRLEVLFIRDLQQEILRFILVDISLTSSDGCFLVMSDLCSPVISLLSQMTLISLKVPCVFSQSLSNHHYRWILYMVLTAKQTTDILTHSTISTVLRPSNLALVLVLLDLLDLSPLGLELQGISLSSERSHCSLPSTLKSCRTYTIDSRSSRCMLGPITHRSLGRISTYESTGICSTF